MKVQNMLFAFSAEHSGGMWELGFLYTISLMSHGVSLNLTIHEDQH